MLLWKFKPWKAGTESTSCLGTQSNLGTQDVLEDQGRKEVEKKVNRLLFFSLQNKRGNQPLTWGWKRDRSIYKQAKQQIEAVSCCKAFLSVRQSSYFAETQMKYVKNSKHQIKSGHRPFSVVVMFNDLPTQAAVSALKPSWHWHEKLPGVLTHTFPSSRRHSSSKLHSSTSTEE